MNPIKGGIITTPFDEPRPLTVPPAQRNHVHGALDIAGGDWIVRAPSSGTAQAFAFFRGVDPTKGIGSWGGAGVAEKPEILAFPWREYWFDTYGAIIALIEPDGRLHLLCHFFPSKLFNPSSTNPFTFSGYLEENETTRWACHLLKTGPIQVEIGQPLAPAGYAGFVVGPTGRHVHWEVHHQATWLDDYSARIHPEKDYLP
jgi:hypothetical protein